MRRTSCRCHWQLSYLPPVPPEGTTLVLQFPQEVTQSRIYLYLLGDFHKGGGGPTHLQDGLSGGDTVLELTQLSGSWRQSAGDDGEEVGRHIYRMV